jgi:hypothetical protein
VPERQRVRLPVRAVGVFGLLMYSKTLVELRSTVVAAGMPVSRHPRHRSVDALLTHTALISDVWRKTAPWDKGTELPDRAETGQ